MNKPTFSPTTIASAHRALNNRQALVITGPQGCGKSVLARMLAAQFGTFVEGYGWQLTSAQGMSELLGNSPDVVIVDECEPLFEDQGNDDSAAKLKQLITSREQCIRGPYGRVRTVPTPRYIFCSGHADFLQAETNNRRFFLVDLQDTQKATLLEQFATFFKGMLRHGIKPDGEKGRAP